MNGHTGNSLLAVPTTGVQEVSAARCLVSHVAEIIRESIAAEHSAGIGVPARRLVILPTRRLGSALLATLVQGQHRAVIAPDVLTLEDFIERAIRFLPPAIATSNPLFMASPWSPTRLRMLLQALIASQPWKYLSLGHAQELLHLFEEMEKSGCRADFFDRVRQILCDDIYRSADALGMIAERVEEAAILHSSFLKLLHSRNGTLAGEKKRLLMAAITEAWSQGNLITPWDSIIIAGFTNVSQTESAFFTTLAKQSNQRTTVNLLVQAPPAALTESVTNSPMQRFVEALTPQRIPQADKRTTGWQRIVCAQFPSVSAEIQYALQEVANAVANGTPPARIALVVTSEKDYGTLLRTTLELELHENKNRKSIDFNIAIPGPLRESGPGGWLAALSALCSAVLEDISYAQVLLDFFAHPITLRQSHEASVDRADFAKLAVTQRAILSKFISTNKIRDLRSLAIALGKRSVEDQLTSAAAEMLPLEYVTRIARFIETMRSKQKKNMNYWLQTFKELVNPHLEPTLQEELPQFDLRYRSQQHAVQQAIKQFFSDIALAYDEQPAQNAACFLKHLRDDLLSAEVRAVGDPLQGVQVIGLSEARHMPFDVAIIIGCADGLFPRAVPRDVVIDQYLQVRAGLPSWNDLEAIEETTFALLCERIPRLYLTYPAVIGDTPVVASRFVKKLEISKQCLALGSPPLDQQHQRAKSELTRLAALPATGYLSIAAILDTKFSASSLRSLINCPYRWALETHKTRLLEFVRDDDPRDQGERLHKIYELFLAQNEQAVAEAKRTFGLIIEPWPERIAAANWPEWSLSRLINIARAVVPKSRRQNSTWHHYETWSFPAFCNHLQGLWRQGNEIVPQPLWLEHRLDGTTIPSPTPVTSVKANIAISGRIDAVQFLADPVAGGQDKPWLLITDYKTKEVPKALDLYRGVEPQLGFYADALQTQFDSRRFLLGYWSIFHGKFALVAAGSSEATAVAQHYGIAVPRNLKSVSEVIDAYRSLWAWRLQNIQQEGALSADTSACGYCNHAGICRKNDPQLYDQSVAAATLNQHLLELEGKNATPPCAEANQ